jgi:hypothetical protein
MLKTLNSDQVHFVALLAKTARTQRDAFLGNVREDDLAESKAARGEHNPTAALGFAPVPDEASQITALHDAIAGLSPAGRSELYTLMRVGQGELSAPKWHRGIAEAGLLGDADLHDHLVKGLYEAKLAS